jgi:hypothetical protein
VSTSWAARWPEMSSTAITEKRNVFSANSAISVVNPSAISIASADSRRAYFTASGNHATMSCRLAKWSTGGRSASWIPAAAAMVFTEIVASAC